jgi:hypothetical protein
MYLQLHEVSADPSVSIYLPTQRVTEEPKQDPIRLRNRLDAAREQLREGGLNHPQIEALLQPATALLDDRYFWQHQSDGLAIFLADGMAGIFRLPFSFPEMTVVDRRFHTTPLLPLVAADDRFYVLALSQNEVVLWQGDRTSIEPMELPAETPTSLAEAQPEGEAGRQLQWHTGTAPAPRGGRRAAVFHGHGGESDEKASIERFFRQVDAGVRELLRADEAPVVLAGVDYLLPLYGGVSDLRTITAQGIMGNPETLAERELHRQAWEIAAPLLAAPRREVLEGYRANLGRGLASNNLLEIVPAIFDGRVKGTVVALDAHAWGRYDPAAHKVRLDNAQTGENEDLIEVAAEQTLLHGGRLFALREDEMPDGAQVVAVYRY